MGGTGEPEDFPMRPNAKRTTNDCWRCRARQAKWFAGRDHRMTDNQNLAGLRRAARSLGFGLLFALLVTACSAEPRWHSKDEPLARDAAQLFRAQGSAGAPRDPYAGEVAEVPQRRNMRPCCAFGAQLHVRVGPVPIPLYFFGNLVDRRTIRHHVYDSGLATLGDKGAQPARNKRKGLWHSEGNGLVYTCRGGFLDIAHLRDYSDTTLYLATMVARLLETGGEITLPYEGATIHVDLRAADGGMLQDQGRWAMATPLAQWLAYQSSIWHEIVTWFGWSTFPLFPEKVSSFSPEDSYSNLLGARIGAAVISQRGARDEFAYNRNVDRWIDRTLILAEAVPVAAAEEAMMAVDGVWWNSGKRVPDFSLVLRRNFQTGPTVDPWLVPPERFGPLLRKACGDHPDSLAIETVESMGGMDFAAQATLVIDLPPDLAAQEPFASLGPRLTQKDFPVLLAYLRKQNEQLFGPLADRPDVAAP